MTFDSDSSMQLASRKHVNSAMWTGHNLSRIVSTARSRMHLACMRKTYIFLLLTVLILPSLGLSRSVAETSGFLSHFARFSLIFTVIYI